MNRKGLLLFDMDGTIADTDPMLFETFNILYDKFNDGKRKSIEEIYYFSGPPIRETLKKEFPQLDQETAYQEFFKISKSLYPTHIFAFPNEKEVLSHLKEKGYVLGIVTNKQHNLAEYVVQLLDLEGLFDIIIGFDDVKNGKPHAEGVLKAMDILKYDKKETIYVGDNDIDYETANNAGVRCALVSNGPRKLNPNLKPYIKFDSYLQLEEKLNG